MIDATVIEGYLRDANPIPDVDDLDADEFARFVAAADTRRTALMQASGTPRNHRTGRRQTYRSRICRRATLSERIPPPTGVVSGPLMPTTSVRKASSVASGSHSSLWSNDFWPARTSLQAILRSPPYAFCTAASKTRTEARQMSGPVPSPSMNGMTGSSGT